MKCTQQAYAAKVQKIVRTWAKSSAKVSMWIFFYRFFGKSFGGSVFFIIFADIKENGNPPLTSSTLIGGGLFALYTPVKGNDIGINYCFFEIGKTHANQDIRDEE